MTPDQIRSARDKLHLTQAQMAQMLGYSATSRVSEIETGKRNPSTAAARLLRAYLDGYRPDDWPQKV